MKIAIITSGILPVPATQGGAVENLIEFYLAENEKKQMHDITVYSIYDKNIEFSNLYKRNSKFTHFSYIKDKLLWYRIKRKLFFLVYRKYDSYYNYYIEYFLHSVLKKMGKYYYDIIILENRPGYALRVHAKYPNARIILHLHNDLLNINTLHSVKIRSFLYKIITVSEFIKKRVETIKGMNSVEVCLNGINLDVFNNLKSKDFIRNELGFRNDDFIVVFSGRIIPEKGVKEFIMAYSYLSFLPNLKFLILGGAFFGNMNSQSEYERDLKNIVSVYGKDKIIFTGFLPYSKIPEFLKCSDVGIVPSVWDEPCSLTSIEGMAAGLPMIVTNSGGIPEFIDTKCAIILKRNENLPYSIADAILYLYNHKNVMNSMSDHSILRSSMFNKETYSELFLKLLV